MSPELTRTGKRKKSEKRRRNHQLTLRLNLEEHSRLMTLSDAAGERPQVLLRRLVDQKNWKPIPKISPEASAALLEIGRDLNHMTMKLHSIQMLNPNEVAALLQKVRRCREHISAPELPKRDLV